MPPHRFDAYTGEHLLLIGAFLLGCVAVGVLGRRLRGHPRERRARVVFALTIPFFTLPWQVFLLLPGEFRLGTSLPLQLCDLAWMLAVFALLTRRRWACQLLYYWGLVLSSQAVFTPDLAQTFPDPRYLMFWGMHFLTVWAAVFLTFGLGVRPDWAGFRRAVLVTAVWAGLALGFNQAAGTNYGYLNRKPAGGSILDLLGPWPAYVVVEIVLVILVFALITWPWVRASRRHPQQGHPGAGAHLDRGDG